MMTLAAQQSMEAQHPAMQRDRQQCARWAAALYAATMWFSMSAHAAGAATLVPAQSQVTFVVKQMGVPVEGRFRTFDARIVLDPKRPETGSVSFVLETASASFGVPEIDAELPKPEWFASQKYPRASFESSRIRIIGGGLFEVTGKLDIKGSVREAVIPVSLVAAGGMSTASGVFKLQRRDFKIGDGQWSDPSLVGDEVQVKFRLVLRGLDQP